MNMIINSYLRADQLTSWSHGKTDNFDRANEFLLYLPQNKYTVQKSEMLYMVSFQKMYILIFSSILKLIIQ